MSYKQHTTNYYIVPTFNPEEPLKPNKYVDKLIRIVQQMAPCATQYQWLNFAKIARNIELSHEHYLGEFRESVISKTNEMELLTVQHVNKRLEKCEEDIEALEAKLKIKKQEQEDLKTVLLHREQFGSSSEFGTSTSSGF